MKVHTITSDGNPELTPLDLAVPSAEPWMLSQSTVHPWQEREISHVATRWEGRKHEYVITQHSCTHSTSCKATFVPSCKQYKHACIQLRSNKSSGPSLAAAWKSLPSAKQASFRRPTVRTPSHAVPEPSKPRSAAKHTYHGGHAVFESKKIVSLRLRILVTPNQQGAQEQNI